MRILRSVEGLRAWRAQQGRLAFVPTMGALHAGHLSLMALAARRAGTVLASVFVNPTQFAPGEDLDRYPRDEEGDLRKCAAAGCAAVFLPPVEALYPPGAATWVTVPALSGALCGVTRPTHFRGVATVVCKLLNLTGCQVAVFGEKDFQQLAVIRRMARDLCLAVEIVGGPTVREADGLAMSSRNAQLSAEERRAARCLLAGLDAARREWESGARDPRRLEAVARAVIEAAPMGQVDYVQARDPDSLAALEGPVGACVLAVAVRFSAARLIDNVVLRAAGSGGSGERGP